MKTPRLRDPWPATVEEYQMYAVCSQLRADHRRQMERTIRQQHRREMAAMLRAGGTTIALLVTLAVAYLMVWGLWAVVTP